MNLKLTAIKYRGFLLFNQFDILSVTLWFGKLELKINFD